MGIDPISALYQSNGGQPAAASSKKQLGKDAFLKLLTTQMQNQDPLAPMDNGQFIAQLAQFTSVEQLMGMNAGIGSLNTGIAAMNNASMAALVGTNVVATGDRFQVDGQASTDLHYNAGAGVSTGELRVFDSEGRVVYTETLSLSEGEGVVSWDGTMNDGRAASAGEYRFDVIGASPAGDEVDVSEQIWGTVTEMDYSTGTPRPTVDGTPLEIGDILRLMAGP